LGLPAVVADDELLVEDLRVEVAAYFDPVTEEGGENDPIDRERLALVLQVLVGGLLVASPLGAVDRFCLRLAAGDVGLRWFRDLVELRADVVLFDEDVDRDALPACIDQRFRDRYRVDLLDGDIERLPRATDEVDDRRLEIVGGAELRRP
jgi:hypothetical protein